jgi:hypothetical protein
MNLTDNDEQIHLMKEMMCEGKVLTSLDAGIAASNAACYRQLQDLAKSLIHAQDLANRETILMF